MHTTLMLWLANTHTKLKALFCFLILCVCAHGFIMHHVHAVPTEDGGGWPILDLRYRLLWTTWCGWWKPNLGPLPKELSSSSSFLKAGSFQVALDSKNALYKPVHPRKAQRPACTLGLMVSATLPCCSEYPQPLLSNLPLVPAKT